MIWIVFGTKTSGALKDSISQWILNKCFKENWKWNSGKDCYPNSWRNDFVQYNGFTPPTVHDENWVQQIGPVNPRICNIYSKKIDVVLFEN